MSDFLKSVFDAWDQRIRSPILGSAILAHFAINWKPYLILIWADGPIRSRIAEFEGVTSLLTLYLLPVGLGVGLGIAMPWVSWFGAVFANKPTKKLREIRAQQAFELRISEINRSMEEEKKQKELYEASKETESAKAEAEKVVDLRRIARAERAESAENLVDGAAAEVIRESLEVERAEHREHQLKERVRNLSQEKKETILYLGKAEKALDLLPNSGSRMDLLQNLKKAFPDYTTLRLDSLLSDCLGKLKSDQILEMEVGNRSKLTQLGYRYYDLLLKEAP